MEAPLAGLNSSKFISRCVSVDLEVDPQTARIFAMAAVADNDAAALVSRKGASELVLDRLEEMLVDAPFLIGHNILRHDLPHLVASRPRLVETARHAIDTLWLNPLAFPRNPYHRLVKHHHDGRLQVGHVNDPELDARLVFDVLQNQIDALAGLGSEDPDALVSLPFPDDANGARSQGLMRCFAKSVTRLCLRLPKPTALSGAC